jgi:hypothetical protein
VSAGDSLEVHECEGYRFCRRDRLAYLFSPEGELLALTRVPTEKPIWIVLVTPAFATAQAEHMARTGRTPGED